MLRRGSSCDVQLWTLFAETDESVSPMMQVMYNVCNCFYLELKHLLATLQRSVLAFKTPSQARHLAEVRHTHTSLHARNKGRNQPHPRDLASNGFWLLLLSRKMRSFFRLKPSAVPHASVQRTPSPPAPLTSCVPFRH